MKATTFRSSFWTDDYATNLSHKEMVLFIYLFTNDRVNMIGLYELPDKRIMIETNLTQQELETIKKKFQEDGRFYFYKSWIYNPRFTRHNKRSSKGDVLIAFRDEFNNIPLDVKKTMIGSDLYTLPFKSTENIEYSPETYMVTVKEMVMVIRDGGSPTPRPTPRPGDGEEIDKDFLEGI